MIQVAQMAHPVLQYVQQHNYPAFFHTEIEARRQFFYPPFSRIILLTFRNKSKELVDGAARQLAAYLKPQYGQYMIGPAEPVVNRVRSQYLMELMFKLPKDSALIQQCKQQIQDQIAVLHYDKRFRSVVIIPDVDTQ